MKKLALTAMLFLVMVGCSGGGSDSGGGEAGYSISGNVTVSGAAFAGVTVTLSGNSSKTTTTDSSGNYTISGLANGNYTLTPGKTGYAFSPTSLAVTVSSSNMTGKNFTAIANSGGSAIQLPKTGQATSYAIGDDGAMQKGVVWPNPRFTDNSDGTVSDNLTGLLWLKNANCTETVGSITKASGFLKWADALTWSNNLESGKCGLSDSSVAGQWRLPNLFELESLVDLSMFDPALPSGHPFLSVQLNNYWSSSSDSGAAIVYAKVVGMSRGNLYYMNKTYGFYVWPVREEL